MNTCIRASIDPYKLEKSPFLDTLDLYLAELILVTRPFTAPCWKEARNV